MDIFRKNLLDDFVSVNAIVSVWRFEISGKGEPIGDLHDFHEMVFVERGKFSVLVDGELFEIGEGEIFLYPPLAFHIGAGKTCENSAIRIISFESDSKILKKIEKRPIKACAAARELFLEANEIGLNSFFYPGEDDGVRGMRLLSDVNVYSLQKMKKSLELALIDLISQTESGEVRQKNSDNFKKEQSAALNDYLRMNISKQLTLLDMANDLSIGISSLKKLSYEAFGTSPGAYFTNLKLSAAKKMIRETSFTFTEIAERLGFGSVHYFSRIFKKRIGMTPSEYAKSI